MVLEAVVSGLPGVFLQTLGFESILFELEQIGLFTYILPFLLLFAVIYGILSWTKIFGGSAGLHAIVAIVIGLLGIRFPVYSNFLAVISPKLGVGLVILLVLILLIGLFVPEGSQAILGWIMIGVGVIIAIVIFAQSYSVLQGLGYGGVDFLDNNLIAWVVLIGLLIGVIVAVVVGNGKNNQAASTSLGRLYGDIVKAASKKS